MNEGITERLQEALVRLRNAARAVVNSDPDLMSERLLDELEEAVEACPMMAISLED